MMRGLLKLIGGGNKNLVLCVMAYDIERGVTSPINVSFLCTIKIKQHLSKTTVNSLKNSYLSSLGW